MRNKLNNLISVRTLNTFKFSKSRDLTKSWDFVRNYDCVYLNLHKLDYNLLLTDNKLVKKQFGEYLAILDQIKKFDKKLVLIGLSRKAELSSFGDVVMNNQLELFNLFFLLFQFQNNLLLDNRGVELLKKKCPNIYKLLFIHKTNYYYNQILHYLRESNANERILIVVDEYLKENFMDLKEKIEFNNFTESFNFNENMRNWSLFLCFYLFLPLLTVSSAVFYGFVKYLYSINRDKFISVTIQDESINSRKNRELKLNKNIHFYDTQRD
uniref:Uncharacterized protein n=1 Tax=Theileria annulata TaxID=5874 RepID=A0A3B0MJE7_THEAN